MMQEMQERMAQLEARQKLREQSMAEQIDAVVKKTEEIEKKAPAGLPTSASWVERIKWSGDFRYRHESNAEDTLSQHRLLVMNDEERVARVGNAAIYGIDKADTIVNFPQQHCASVGCKAAAVKISLDDFFVF